MADKNTQKQTAAAPAAGGSPASTGTPCAAQAAPAQSKTETGDLARDLLEAAFAEAEANEPEGQQAPVQTPAQEEHPEAPEALEGQQDDDGDPEEVETPPETTPEDEQVELDTIETDDLTEEAMKRIKGADKVPKGFVKRLVKQSAQIRQLKQDIAAKQPFVITPTDNHPLADVTDLSELDARRDYAKNIIQWCKAHPDGGELTRNGKRIELGPDEVQASLAQAERELEAFPDHKLFLAQRAQSKPWEQAASISPEMFKEGSTDHKLYTGLLQAVPGLVTGLQDHEVFVAAAIRGLKMINEEKAGRAKWVRMELDAKGNPILPGATRTATPPVKPKPPSTPTQTRPPLQSGSKPVKRSQAEVIASLPEELRNDPDARLRALIENAEAA